jgi:phospholipid/cholesterol/gamma-HCH transport system substrate-binding protein
MSNSASSKLKTGIFVVVAFALLGVLIFFIGKKKNLFGETFTVYANFKNIAGLKMGNFVRYAGINVGTVDNIAIVNDTTVRVDLLLQKSIQPYIKTDVMASIGSDGLMGDKLVQLGPGSNSASLVRNGGQLKAADPADMDKMIAKFNEITTNAASLTGGLADIVNKINTGQGSLGRLMSSDKLAKELESTVSTTQQTVSTINKTASSVKDNMDAAKHSILFRGYFKKKEKKRLQDSVNNAKKNVPDTLAPKKN